MSSILKVDQLQDSGGNAIITSDGSGNLTAGTIPAKTIGTGAVLQVVQSIASTETIVSSSSFTDTGLSASITPTSTSSKILVTVYQVLDITDNTNGVFGGIRLLRGTTSIFEPGPSNSSGSYLIGSNTFSSLYTATPLVYLDTPSTTSATTYKTQGAIYNGQDQIVFQRTGGVNQGKSTITLMEIAG